MVLHSTVSSQVSSPGVCANGGSFTASCTDGQDDGPVSDLGVEPEPDAGVPESEADAGE